MARGKGDGSIFQRQDTGKWVAMLTLPDGKRRTFYGATRKEAAEKLHDARQALKLALPVPTGRESLAQFLQRWLTDVAAQRVRPSTLRDYRGDLNRYIVPELGRLKLAEVTPQRVQAFLNGLAARGLGTESVRHVRAVLRVALGRAVREGLIGQNAARLVDTPRQARKQVAALTPDDARALLAAFTGHELEPLVTLALATGLRQGELLGLGWDDVDVDAGTLTVRRQLQRIDRAYRLTEPKSVNSRRTLVLPRVAVEALRAQRVRQAALRLRAGPFWEETARVFTTTAGGYVNASSVTHRFSACIAAASRPHLRFHDLRHGAAALLLAQGASMRVVMEQLGHSQISLTMNTYAAVAPALLRDAADKLDQALGGT